MGPSFLRGSPTGRGLGDLTRLPLRCQGVLAREWCMGEPPDPVEAAVARSPWIVPSARRRGGVRGWRAPGSVFRLAPIAASPPPLAMIRLAPAPIAVFPKPAPQTDKHRSWPAEANRTRRGGQKGPDPRSARGRIPRSAAKSGAASPDPLRTSLERRFWAWPPPRAWRAPRVQAGRGCGPGAGRAGRPTSRIVLSPRTRS